MDLNILDLGRCGYQEALEIQYDILKKRQDDNIEDTLILVEHPPVITIGRNGFPSNIIVPEKYLKEQGVEVHQVERGGDVTYHGPGQIVGYPIVKLKDRKMGIRDFVEGIEETFIQLLGENYSIIAGRNSEHTGVWIDNNKILAIGLAVKRGVTMHGFAFNVKTKLDHFNLIVPCGISNKGVTSIEHITGHPAELAQVNKQIIKHFSKSFDYNAIQK
ncbi:MAG: lipB [Anaerosolibacter sp.]|jgi:lipoyl(octanoyl) transferase|uniref:lipoyl(octanoyl) transferase LipB n=1 Tax=Anaerosolibacter sp. TaxID=1872527 RepID=UPI00262F6865|nr:lipoyl(octanoyl) transferase LipB [Anaerosolibacter sp.]MDF2545187.1 lipB [Anaerosolibacter sp.]